MKSNDLKAYLLFIEPTQRASAIPVIDELTRKMAAALRAATPSAKSWFGVHECVCGVASTNHNYILADGRTTHSLCVHYLARHRPQVPDEQLQEVAQLGGGELEPTEWELNGIPITDARERSPEEERARLEESHAGAAKARLAERARFFGENTIQNAEYDAAQAAEASLSDAAAIDAFIRGTMPKLPDTR